MAEKKIGLALSGGGFRAAAFHLGVLKRLEELGILPSVALVSTVSGGSITGALYALRCAHLGDGNLGSWPVESLVDEVRTLSSRNLRGKALFGTPLRVLRTVASFILPFVRRTPLIVRELDRVAFKEAKLPDLPPKIVINATSLATGKAWKFFRDRAGDYLIGATDKTSVILVSEAVGASAAFPVLADPFPFRANWEDLRGDLLDSRWERPGIDHAGQVSRWRSRFGRQSGSVTIPLVDGGVYDNEGLNSLAGAKVTHAIVSSTAPPDSEGWSVGTRSLVRSVDVMHSRLGAATRKLAHEMTHGTHPGDAAVRLREIAKELRLLAGREPPLAGIAERVEAIATVGWPPRGHQFSGIAPILLHRTDLARNESAKYKEAPYDVPVEDRGLLPEAVEELARVRTDLDAFEPQVFDCLVAQGYFLTDASLKIGMPELVSGFAQGSPAPRPTWKWAHQVIEDGNANIAATKRALGAAGKRRPLGRFGNRVEAAKVWISLATSCAILAAIAVVVRHYLH